MGGMSPPGQRIPDIEGTGCSTNRPFQGWIPGRWTKRVTDQPFTSQQLFLFFQCFIQSLLSQAQQLVNLCNCSEKQLQGNPGSFKHSGPAIPFREVPIMRGLRCTTELVTTLCLLISSPLFFSVWRGCPSKRQFSVCLSAKVSPAGALRAKGEGSL